jgi:hypothetical protein
MERALPLTNRHAQLLAQHVYGAVVWHLEVVDARHDGREVVVGCVGWFARLAHDGEHGREALEA